MKRQLAKRLILFGLIIFLGIFWLCTQASALEVGLNEISSPLGLGQEDIRVTIAKVINLSLGILGLVDLLIIIVAGALYLTALGDQERIAKAKKVLIYAGTGLIIILAAFSITNFIFNELIGAVGVGGNANEAPVAGEEIPPYGTYICTGDDPDWSVMCDYDDYDLTKDLPKTLVANCTEAKKCEYICNSGYLFLGGNCQKNPCGTGFIYTGGICKATGFAEITADNMYDLYLNGALVGSAGTWEDIEKYQLNFTQGLNVMAIKAQDMGEAYGLIARFGYGSQTYFVTKGGDSNWKCKNYNYQQSDPSGWQNVSFNDSAWAVPVKQTDIWSPSGRLQYKIPVAEWIWTPTGGSGTRILCRYKYTF